MEVTWDPEASDFVLNLLGVSSGDPLVVGVFQAGDPFEGAVCKKDYTYIFFFILLHLTSDLIDLEA